MIFVAVLAAGLAGCQLTSSSKIPLNNNTRVFFGSDAESSIGAREHPRVVASYGGVYKNAGAEEAVAKAVGRLVAASQDPSQAYKVTILNSPAINAFALPGGYLYVTRGLLALANDTSEVAAVLAHEMAHVTAHHGAARQQQEEAAALASKVVTNIVDDPEEVEAAVESSQRSLARFTQVQELQADAIGVRTLGKAGYDPYAAARFLKTMGRFADYTSARGDAKAAPDFLSTHPATPSRIARAVREARQFGAPGIGEQDRDAYLSKLDGMLYGDDPLQGFVRGRSFLHKALGIGFTVPDGFTLENTPQAVLASDGKGTALRFDGAELASSESLSDYISSGWINGLVENSIRQTTVNGLPAITATALAEGWSFRIGLVRKGETVYRFILATREPTEAFLASFEETFKSFRQLSLTEQARLRPLTIRIVTVSGGQTVHDLARRMSGVDPSRRVELFTLLNGLDEDTRLTIGQSVKLIVD
ncbi:M48 family metalloprotease [Breoghania sp. JC706]|uniref:M48 family metalloprotease n=1 Tax=Breoghania sp. JC706 TaxID=3117732 RepID=UPI00300B9C47